MSVGHVNTENCHLIASAIAIVNQKQNALQILPNIYDWWWCNERIGYAYYQCILIKDKH